MIVINGVWHDAHLDPPETNKTVLAVKQLKNGQREICLAYCLRDWKWKNPATSEVITKNMWICQGNNNILFWMPLPKIPEVDPE